MLSFDYVTLTALSAVIREGSFESAAKFLGITQSAVSQRIKALEEKVGSLLIVRGRPCVPTEIGLQLVSHLEQVSLLQHELINRVDALSDGDSGEAATVRVSVNNDSLATWFPAVVKRAARDLNILFDLVPDDQEHTEGNLKSGEALAVVTSSGVAMPGCRHLPLGSMAYVAVASRGFYDAHFLDGVSPKSLEGTVCLAFDRKDSIQEQWMNLCFNEAVAYVAHLVPSYEGYLACCLNGTGWGLVPHQAAKKHIRTGDLVELSPGRSVDVELHWQASSSSDILRRLGDVVLAEAKEALLPNSSRTN